MRSGERTRLWASWLLELTWARTFAVSLGLDGSGRVVLRRRMRREAIERFVEGLPRCIVAMEACCGAHHLGRAFGTQGHEVRLMSPEYGRPYVKAIAEAATRPTMRFVPVKSVAQSDVQALHRARERLVGERTALINHLRALCSSAGSRSRRDAGSWRRSYAPSPTRKTAG